MRAELSAGEVARVAHEVNRAYCAAIGDSSQPSWDNAPDWQRKSAVQGVWAIFNKPGTTPEQSHESWSEQKIADGWTYGEVKDPILKTHPCLVAYSQLPLEQRVKDYLFGAVVRSLT